MCDAGADTGNADEDIGREEAAERTADVSHSGEVKSRSGFSAIFQQPRHISVIRLDSRVYT